MKRKLYIIGFFSFLILVLSITGTYALFENNGEGVLNEPIAKWNIKLNEINISEGYTEDLVINDVNYTQNVNVQDGYIAPGRIGYFDIVLDPTGTEVAVRYDITFDLSSLDYPDNIVFTMTNDAAGSVVQTGENTFSGVISLDDIDNGSNVTLHLNIDWQDDGSGTYDETDTQYGMNKEMEIALPITFSLSQYLGEELVEYTPQE